MQWSAIEMLPVYLERFFRNPCVCCGVKLVLEVLIADFEINILASFVFNPQLQRSRLQQGLSDLPGSLHGLRLNNYDQSSLSELSGVTSTTSFMIKTPPGKKAPSLFW